MGNSQNLKKILRDKKIQQKQLSLTIHVPESTVSSWFKKDTNIPSEYVIPICDFLNISPYLLLAGKEYYSNNNIVLSAEEKKIVNEYRYLSNESKSDIRSSLKHLYDMEMSSELSLPTISIKHSAFKVSAGVGEWLSAPDEWENIVILDTPQSRKADFALTIKGDSMTPDFEDGDIVLVKQQSSVDIGQICIYTIDGNGYIKKFGGDRLISLNDKYDDIFLKDYQNIICNGLVVGKV